MNDPGIVYLDGVRAPLDVLAAAAAVVEARDRSTSTPSTSQVHEFFGQLAETIKRAGGQPR
jgi:hypothetical protein